MMDQDLNQIPSPPEQPTDSAHTFIAPLAHGDFCPVCGQGRMEYNCLLNLECTNCHFEAQGGAFT